MPSIENHREIFAYLEAAYLTACKYGNLEVVKYLLNSSELKQNVEINSYTGLSLSNACEYGHLDIVKYLLTSSELKEHFKIKSDTPIYNACIKEQTDVLEFFLTDPLVKPIIAKQADSNFVFYTACDEGKLDVVKFLLTDPIIKNEISIHFKEDKSFKAACKSRYNNIIQYLIFEQNIEKTQAINEYLIETGNKDIDFLFQKRKLKSELNTTLGNTSLSKIKNIKI